MPIRHFITITLFFIRLFFLMICLLSSKDNVGYSQTKNETKIYALVVGISSYPHFKDKLTYAHRDAEEFAKFLMSKEGGTVPKGNIKLLINEAATIEKIYLNFRELRSLVDNNSLLVVFFAGHGVEDTDEGQAYFMTWEAKPDLPKAGGIRADDFYKEIKNTSNSKGSICFIDACHAGAAVSQGRRTRTENNNTAKLFQEQFKQVFVDNPKGINNGLFSAGFNQKAMEDPTLRQGVFTYFLLKGLRGEADNDHNCIVDMGELKDYVITKVTEHVRTKFRKEQIPVPTQDLTTSFPISQLSRETCEDKNSSLKKEVPQNSAREVCFNPIINIIPEFAPNGSDFPVFLKARIAGGSNFGKVLYSWRDSSGKLIGSLPMINYDGKEVKKRGSEFVTITAVSENGTCEAKGTVKFGPNNPPTVALQIYHPIKSGSSLTQMPKYELLTDTICPGDILALYAVASDPDGDNLTYVWSSTGGKLEGDRFTSTDTRFVQAKNAIFDSSGLAPGEYVITVEVRDNCVRHCSSYDTKIIKVSNCPPK